MFLFYQRNVVGLLVNISDSVKQLLIHRKENLKINFVRFRLIATLLHMSINELLPKNMLSPLMVFRINA